MFLLSMKVHDRNNLVPLMSEKSNSVAVLVDQAETMFEMLTRHKQWDRTVIDTNFESKRMSDAGMDLLDGKIDDFEWAFVDKYDRRVVCYISRND